MISLDGNVAALRQKNQTNLIATTAKIAELQRQNTQNLTALRTESADHLASVYRNHHALFEKMITTFETRERETVLKQEVREREMTLEQEKR